MEATAKVFCEISDGKLFTLRIKTDRKDGALIVSLLKAVGVVVTDPYNKLGGK